MDSRQRSCVMSCENSCEQAWLWDSRKINKDFTSLFILSSMLFLYLCDMARLCNTAVSVTFKNISEIFTALSHSHSYPYPPVPPFTQHNSTALTENENQF